MAGWVLDMPNSYWYNMLLTYWTPQLGGFLFFVWPNRQKIHNNAVSTLCEGSETLTEWKSNSINYFPYLFTGVGARDDYESKILSLSHVATKGAKICAPPPLYPPWWIIIYYPPERALSLPTSKPVIPGPLAVPFTDSFSRQAGRKLEHTWVRKTRRQGRLLDKAR